MGKLFAEAREFPEQNLHQLVYTMLLSVFLTVPCDI